MVKELLNIDEKKKQRPRKVFSDKYLKQKRTNHWSTRGLAKLPDWQEDDGELPQGRTDKEVLKAPKILRGKGANLGGMWRKTKKARKCLVGLQELVKREREYAMRKQTRDPYEENVMKAFEKSVEP